ncbi:outer membrane lipoprotein chaperone LolA [Pseudoalteromonas pernae]|uniref:outer membrane lipoprotein chaperone LolA n=1 Tax=Pseudoalteromonas pernae TaxID=3118054 RepID=UPI003241DCE1
MKKIFTAALFSVSALTSALATASDADDLKKVLSNLTSLDTGFNQQVFDPQGEVVSESAGQLQLEQPRKIRWQQHTPDETLFVSNGEESFYFDPFAEQVTLLDTEKLIDSTPFILLTTSDEALWQNFAIAKVDGGYAVTPLTKEQGQVEQLTLLLNADNQVSAVEVIDQSGQRSRFTFQAPVLNEDINDEQFEFVIPENVFVDDQRQTPGTQVSGE